MREKLIGTYYLKSWQYLVDGKELALWEKKQGILIYTEDGTMSAILMDSSRENFKTPYLSKGTVKEKESAINGYVSYAGNFEVDNEKVYHHVQFSLLPNWIGTTLERFYEFSEKNLVLTLSTTIEMSPKGKAIKNILTWIRK